jgi:HAD superfamily hydrolase (TIGR01549 family)
VPYAAFLATLFVTSSEEAACYMPIRAVIFDLDGTITQPYFDFDAIREEIGIGKDEGPVLEAMERMTAKERQRAEQILHKHEEKALAASVLNPRAGETLDELRRRGLPIGILTRNRKRNAESVAEMHGLHFDSIVGREDGPVKPNAFGVLHLCRHFGVEPVETMLVGDYLYDLQCARAAGATAVLIANHHKAAEFVTQADFAIERLDEILGIIDDKNRDDGARP